MAITVCIDLQKQGCLQAVDRELKMVGNKLLGKSQLKVVCLRMPVDNSSRKPRPVKPGSVQKLTMCSQA